VKIFYASVGTAVLALGVLHMATTFRLSSSPTAKVWFFGAGMAIALGGVMNLLNRSYGLGAVGLRAACIGTNALMVCLVAVAGRVTGASPLQQATMLTLMTVALLLSALRSASITPAHSA
jgi:peptidoglycan/LPS O-acetylase OafA/YrhL